VNKTRRRTDQPAAIFNFNVKIKPSEQNLNSMLLEGNDQGQGGARLQKFNMPQINTEKSGLELNDLKEAHDLFLNYASNQMFYPGTKMSETESDLKEFNKKDFSSNDFGPNDFGARLYDEEDVELGEINEIDSASSS
jgi:hypothetical protein